MLLPILQAALRELGPIASRVPKHYYHIAARSGFEWYQRLEYNDKPTKDRIDAAINWAVRDLAADGLNVVTGLPIGSVINKLADIVLDKAKCKKTPESQAYVAHELKQELQSKGLLQGKRI